MSGLFGALWAHAAQHDATLAERMNGALSHRPADRVQHAQFGPCLLGVRSKLPTQHSVFVGAQGCVCVLDGRLDRRSALRATLATDASSDEALVVLAYQRWGVGFAAQLSGDFALALFDPNARRLLLVRDALGVRALYYAHHQDVLLFGSQPKPLLAAGVDGTASPLRMAQYLARDFGDLESTFLRGVRRVPPGHALLVEQGTRKLVCYFQLDETRRAPARSSAEHAAQFRQLFCEAVRERTREGEHIGCLLSGGLDSSGVLGALRQLAPTRDVPCFSARFPDFPEIDEGEWLALLAARGGLALHELRADRVGPLDDIEVLHAHCDEPFHAPNLFIYHQLSKLARAHDVSVLLDGLDGDTVVEHGFSYLHELLTHGKVRRVARELRALRKRLGMGYGSMIGAWLLAPERERAQALLTSVVPAAAGYASRDFAHDSGFHAYAGERAKQHVQPRSYYAQHRAALSSPLLAFYLEVHDKVAAAHGVDHRHPFFDRQLVELCLSLPGEQRLHDGWDRVVQRRAFVDLVPDEICARQSKSVWTDNFQTQLFARHGELLRRLVHSQASPLRGLCDMRRLAHDFSRLQAQTQPARVLDFWCAITLGLWLEQRT